MYEGVPPWDIGRPQTEFVRLAESGLVRGSVLDAGCGTGEHVLLFASWGHETWGVDASPRAIEKARAKAKERGLEATLRVHDALELGTLGRAFDNVTDSGLFHVFSDDARPLYARSLASALRVGGRYFMMCFSEREPDWGGPRRVTQREIRATFKAPAWRIDEIRASRFEGNLDNGFAEAWSCAMTRL